MQAVDTNILIRFLVRDDEAQAKKVLHFLQRAERDDNTLLIPLLVVLEMIWVLSTAYRYKREDILDAIEGLLSLSVFTFESREVLLSWLVSSRNSGLELDDLLIGCSAENLGANTTHTFDKKAAKSELFSLL